MKAPPPPRPTFPPKEEYDDVEWRVEHVAILFLALAAFGAAMFFIFVGIEVHHCRKY